MRRSAFLSLNQFVRRGLHSSTILFSKGKTLEPKPIPGTKEHLEPNAWAKRLFELHEKRNTKTVKYADASPLHMICRIKPLKGVPYYERALLEKFGLGEPVKKFHWVVVENIPSVNSELNTIKHLIRIQPVIFPQGLPSDADDLTQCRLMPDGRFLRTRGQNVRAKVVPDSQNSVSSSTSTAHASLSDDAQIKLFTHSQSGNKGYLTRSYLRSFYNKQWNKFSLFNEHFASHYRYKLNQDGMEYRYSRLWRLDNAMFQSAQNQFNADGTRKMPNQNRFEADWMTYPWSRF